MNRRHVASARSSHTYSVFLAAGLLTWCSTDQFARAAFPFTKIIDVNTQAPSETLGFTYDTFGRPAIHNGFITFRAATTVPSLGTRSS
jgi:hypothetical protein